MMQLVTTVQVEKSTARDNYEASMPILSIWRNGDGEAGLALRMSF